MKRIQVVLIVLVGMIVANFTGCIEENFVGTGICYYDWDIDRDYTIGEFYSSLGEYQYEAEYGYVFAIVTLKIYNQADTVVSTDPFFWHLEVNGTQYSYHLATYDDSIGHETVDVSKGEVFETKIVYEIPADAADDDIKLVYVDPSAPIMKHDPDLIYDYTGAKIDLSSHLAIIDSNAYSYHGWTYVFGIVKNIGSTNLRFVKVGYTLYNGSTVIAKDYTYVNRPLLEPGETSSFWTLVKRAPFTSYDVEILDATEVDYTDWIGPNLHISNVYRKDTHYGVSYINGTIENTGTDDASFVTIYAILYDANGKIIGVADGFPTKYGSVMHTLFPGEVGEFTIYLFQGLSYAPDSTVASYELEVGGYSLLT